eukprot:7884324-Alexandrium_andersonii.AAC.1
MYGTSHRSSARRCDALRRPAWSSPCAPRRVVASWRGKPICSSSAGLRYRAGERAECRCPSQ